MQGFETFFEDRKTLTTFLLDGHLNFENTIYIIKETYLNLKIDDRQLGITQACHTKTNAAPSRLNH